MSEDKNSKYHRLFNKFCNDFEVPAATQRLAEAAAVWCRLREHNIVNYALVSAELSLFKHHRKRETLVQNAQNAAASWCKTDEEPK
jgi:hypothetical protein